MVRAIVLWEQPPETDWYERHLERCRKVPGAVVRSGRVFGSPGGEPDVAHYAEFEFADRESFTAGVNSREMQEVAEDARASGIPFKTYFVDVG